MANTISPVEDFWRGATETEAFRLFEQLDKTDPDNKELADSAEDLLAIMSDSSEEKRIEIANRIVKGGKPDLGIANLVLARATDNLADKEKHYRAAQQNTTDQQFKALGNAGVRVKADSLYAAITQEFADVLWRNGKQDAAIKELQELQSNATLLWLNQDILDGLFASLTTYLICANKTTEARNELERDPAPLAHWYYLNALVKFKEMGDCIQSRSALSVALNDSVMIAVILTDERDEMDEDEQIDAESLLTDWDEQFAQITMPAWKQTPGALEWLSKIFDTKHLLYGAEEVQDEIRFKKWQREMELADTHLRREDFKSTKKAFKTALREADMLNDGGDMFLLTAKMLGAVLLEAGESLGDMKTVFEKKVAWLDKQQSDDFESLFNSYSNFAKTAFELGMHKDAVTLAKKAIEHYEKSIENGSEKLDYFYCSECLYIYAVLQCREENFEEAERAFSKLVGMQEEFLGKNAVDLAESLIGLRLCLHKLKRHDEEKVVHERLLELDSNFDADDETEFVCDAIPVESK